MTTPKPERRLPFGWRVCRRQPRWLLTDAQGEKAPAHRRQGPPQANTLPQDRRHLESKVGVIR